MKRLAFDTINAINLFEEEIQDMEVRSNKVGVNKKQWCYDSRLAYTLGFNDGLTGKSNNPKLSYTKRYPNGRLNFHNDLWAEEIKSEDEVLDKDSQSIEYFKIGYINGYADGGEIREEKKGQILEKEFDDWMYCLANSIAVMYLEINENTYLHGLDFNPDWERSTRLRHISNFIPRPADIKFNHAKFEEIANLIDEHKLQQAIIQSVIYFKETKYLTGFSAALSLNSKLRKLRENLKNKKIESDTYMSEKKLLVKLTRQIINEAGRETSSNS